MKKLLITLVLLIPAVAFGYYQYGPQQNPDPNHTHADFGVWVNDQRVDFSKDEYMSGVSTDEATHPLAGPRKYLHLHDENGNVIHRHKPGLTLGDFFKSLDLHFTTAPNCLTEGVIRQQSGEGQESDPICDEGKQKWRFFVDGTEKPYKEASAYVFADGESLLLTYNASDAMVQGQLSALTSDACKYSKTCPWKGQPPTESCLADPEVPCVQ